MLTPTLDTLIVITKAAIVTAITAVLADASIPVDDSIQLRLVLLPLCSGVLVSGAFILLCPRQETRRIVVGRALVALLAAVVLPQMLGYLHPSIVAFAQRPFPLLFMGGSIAGLFYVVSRPFCSGMYERAGRVAEYELNKLEALQRGMPAPPIPTEIKKPASGIIDKL